ncbi:MAG TPA: peptide-methionine (S)-S-oxide reductase MsrA [Candidatus Paceibacterota bacterium]
MDKTNLINSVYEIAVFGGGCFWCTEAIFSELTGVISVVSGYAGGTKKNPSYEDVSGGTTGHAEVIKIEFSSKEINYEDLLTVFFATHDPTTLNRQGADVGTQYRSIILYTTAEQKDKAERFINELDKDGGDKIVTEVKPLEDFYEAEEYHKDYYARNIDKPYCQVVISPKLNKLRSKFKELLKNKK